MNTQQFIETSRKVHSNKYTYSNTVYDRSYIQVCITCRKHGDYYTLPNTHLRGTICNKCHREKQLKKVLEYFKYS